jgi:signal transduction histidine kinase
VQRNESSVWLVDADSEEPRQPRPCWARELHDETLQSLANLRLTLAGAQRNGKPEAMFLANSQAISQLESDIANLRALISDLRPAALDQLGTDAALNALADRLRHTGLDLDVSIDLAYEHDRAGERHTPELETTIYRIIQEALGNAIKHGHARRAVVEVIEHGSTVCLTVRDDGEGFDPARETDGFGLLGMRERAELLGGTVSVESAPGKGATIKAKLPAARRGHERPSDDLAFLSRSARG